MNLEEFNKWLEAASDRLESTDYQPGLQLVKPIIQKRIDQNFSSKSDADGKAWPPRKEKKKHPLLVLSGLMKNSIVTGSGGGYEDKGPTHLTLGIDAGSVPYAGYQEFGTRRIPARSYANVNDQTLDEATEVFADWVFDNVILGG